MALQSRVTVCYKYTTDLETPTYWQYKEPFPTGWIWISEDQRGSETFEYFQGPQSTESEMLDYLTKKFIEFQKRNTISYFRFF